MIICIEFIDNGHLPIITVLDFPWILVSGPTLRGPIISIFLVLVQYGPKLRWYEVSGTHFVCWYVFLTQISMSVLVYFSQNAIGRPGNCPYDSNQSPIRPSWLGHFLLWKFLFFRSDWNRVRTNLPIYFEILTLNFEPLHGMAYIKRKHAICRTQKHAN